MHFVVAYIWSVYKYRKVEIILFRCFVSLYSVLVIFCNLFRFFCSL